MYVRSVSSQKHNQMNQRQRDTSERDSTISISQRDSAGHIFQFLLYPVIDGGMVEMIK
jgi:hypothetical protein